MSISIKGYDHERLASYGLSDQPQMEDMTFCNERPSGFGDDEGDWFATIENHVAPNKSEWHVLISGTHGNDHSPGASYYTRFDLYDVTDPDEIAEFIECVDAWEAEPERIDD